MVECNICLLRVTLQCLVLFMRLGAISSNRIRRAGYPIRHAFQEFVNRYYMLKKGLKVSDNSINVIEKCKKILMSTLGEGLWQIGKTKVFLKVRWTTMYMCACRGRTFRRSIISSNSKEKEFVRLKISSMDRKSV